MLLGDLPGFHTSPSALIDYGDPFAHFNFLNGETVLRVSKAHETTACHAQRTGLRCKVSRSR